MESEIEFIFIGRPRNLCELGCYDDCSPNCEGEEAIQTRKRV